MSYYGRRPGLTVGEAAAVAGLGLGAVALVIGVIVAVTSEDPQPEAIGVCVDPSTNERVDDDRCGEFGLDGSATYGGGVHYMVFDTRTYKGDIPAVGKPLPPTGTSGYVRTYSDLSRPVAAAPKAGGPASTIVRGGLGVKGGGVAGGRGGSAGG